MNNYLAIDTSSSACSVAVCANNKIVDEFVLAPQDHIRRLLPMVDKLLAESGIHLTDLDAIVFSAGPGSFTGLRICLGTVQGLAFGADLPVIPISTMLVCAETAARTKDITTDAMIVPCFDARMGEVYWGAFNKLAEQPLDRVEEDKVTALGDVITQLEDWSRQKQPETAYLVGDGWGLLSEEQGNSLKKLFSHITIDTTVYPHARDLPALADEYLKTQKPISAMDAEPCYVRNEVSWKKREKIRS